MPPLPARVQRPHEQHHPASAADVGGTVGAAHPAVWTEV